MCPSAKYQPQPNCCTVPDRSDVEVKTTSVPSSPVSGAQPPLNRWHSHLSSPGAWKFIPHRDQGGFNSHQILSSCVMRCEGLLTFASSRLVNWNVRLTTKNIRIHDCDEALEEPRSPRAGLLFEGQDIAKTKWSSAHSPPTFRTVSTSSGSRENRALVCRRRAACLAATYLFTRVRWYAKIGRAHV